MPPDLASLTPGLVGRETAEHLASLAAEVPAELAIVEIGVFLARTTVYLGKGAQSGHGAHVYGIDPWDLPGHRYPYKWLHHPSPRRARQRQMFTKPETRVQAEANVRAAGLTDAVTLIRGFSVGVASNWSKPKIGLLFVDGDHREEYVRADWAAWRVHLAPSAVVVFDDYHPGWPGVPAAVNSFTDLEMVEVIARKGGGLAVLRYAA